MSIRLLTRRAGETSFATTTPATDLRAAVAAALADPAVTDVLLEDTAATSLRDRIVVLVVAKLGAEPRS